MSSPNRTRQVAAIVSLLCVAALVVVLAVFLWNNAWSLVIALVGLAITAVGGWWAVTKPMPRRAIGIVVALVGVAVIVAGAHRRVLRRRPGDRPARRGRRDHGDRHRPGPVRALQGVDTGSGRRTAGGRHRAIRC